MHDNPSRTKPAGLARYANEFFEAALAADDKLGTKPGYEIIAPTPVLYLTGHAIELILKAYLLEKGVHLSELRRKSYGHNLNKCITKANQLGLNTIVTLDAGEQEALQVLNELYKTKQLNYIVTGSKTYPSFGPLETLTKKLLSAIGPTVGYK